MLTDKLEIVIIELPKAKRIYERDMKNPISHWMMFLDEPNKKEVGEIMSYNEEIKKAIEELERVSGNEELERIAELRIKAIRDEQAAIEYATEKRLRRRTKKTEWSNGIEKKSKEIAKNMLKRNMKIDVIEEITGLSKEVIQKLQK